MQITIFASGSRGDVQPYVALGQGLKKAGHGVRVLATQDFQDLITAYDLDFVGSGGSSEAVARSMQDLLERGKFLKILSQMGQASQQGARQAAVSGLEACSGSDLIIGGFSGLAVGMALAEKLGIPFLPAYLLPFTPTGAFPSVLMPLPQLQLPGWANAATHRLTQQVMWQSFRAADNTARATVLHMEPARFWGPFAGFRQQQQTTLYAYSPHVVPSPPDWGGAIHVTGYWFLDPPAAWEPPPDLVAFLESGPPPIYVGFGSMSSSKPEEAADLVLQALARTGQRGVLYAGWGGLKKEQLPNNLFMVGSVPHIWLLPQMAAVVHHGGAGTTAASLRAGVPTIVTPFFADQPFWGQRVYALGVGPKPIPRKRLTTGLLAEAINTAVTDQTMRARAADLGERIRAENGVAQAVAVIEQNGGR